MATYHDVRELTGLSLSTISKYFNDLPIREKNRVAIEAAVRQLGFRPNAFARGLRSKRSQSVGVLLPNLGSAFHLAIIAQVERTLKEAGISMIVRSRRGEGEDDTDPSEAIQALMSTMIDGLIAAPLPGDAEALRGIGVPLVVIDLLADGLESDAVILDNEGAGAQAARLLTDHGHRDIAVIGGNERVWTMPRRLAGFREVLHQRGIALPPERVEISDLTVADAREAMRHILALDNRPSAVFTVNYDLTLGALIAINESGLRIPEDISFVGFDVADIAPVLRPPLTYVAQPVDRIAQEAARLMLDRLENPDSSGPAVMKVLPGRLVLGGSVRRAD